MSGKDTPRRQRSEAEIREDRLKLALKANLARRKAQSRVRQEGGVAPAEPEGQNSESMSGKDSEQEG